jgi:cobalamin biosynthesis protein CobT
MPTLNTLVTIGSVVAGDNVAVVLGNSTQVTKQQDGSFLITLRLSESMTDEDLALVDGYLDHECSHVRFTNFDVFKNVKNNNQHEMTNLIEDIRIEKLIGLKYPGAAINLNRMVCVLCRDESFWSFSKSNDSLLSLVSKFALYLGRSAFLKQKAMSSRAQSSAEILLKRVGPGRFNQFKQIVSDIGFTKSTKESYDLAVKLLSLIDDVTNSGEDKIPDVSNTQNDPQNNDPSQEPQSSDDQNPANNNQEQKSDPSTNTPVNDNQSSDKPSSDQGNPTQSQNQTPDTSIPKGIGDLNSVINSIAEQYDDDMQLDNPDKFNVLKHIKSLPKRESSDSNGFSAALADPIVTQACNNAFQQWARSLTMSSSVYRARGRNIDQSKLWGVNAGRTRVFKKESRSIAPEAAVLVIKDRSGSMKIKTKDGKTRSYHADIATASIKEALSMDGFVCSVIEFNSLPRLVSDWDSNAMKFSSSVGGTEVIPALATAIPHIIKRKEERKIIMLLTDGDFEEDLLPAISEMESLGIDFCAIRFGEANCSIKDFPENLNPFCDDLADLSDVMSQVICDCLTLE